LSNFLHQFYRGKSGTKIWATAVIKKLQIENDHPTGENSPNLVTLLRGDIFFLSTREDQLENRVGFTRRSQQENWRQFVRLTRQYCDTRQHNTVR
jgi:hypothetical protein